MAGQGSGEAGRKEGGDTVSQDRVRPFSQGTQYLDWQEGNCCRCAKYNTEGGEVVHPVCELDEALMVAMFDDGTISREIADRLGVPRNTWSDWACKEFAPEPPELPDGVERRVPAPGQLSLFPTEA